MAPSPQVPIMALINLGVAGVLIIAWLSTFASYSWHQKLTLLIGFDFSLTQARVYNGPLVSIQMPMGDKARRAAEQDLKSVKTGEYSLAAIKETMCSLHSLGPMKILVGEDFCTLFRLMQYASVGLLIIGIFGVVFLAVGAGCSYKYWFDKPRAKVRTWMMIGYGVAPNLFFVGIVQYTFLTSHLSRLPPAGSSTFSYSYMVACTLTVLSFLPILFHVLFEGKSLMEDIHEGLSEQKHFLREVEATEMIADVKAYGSTMQYADPMQQQYADPMQQQYADPMWYAQTMPPSTGMQGSMPGMPMQPMQPAMQPMRANF